MLELAGIVILGILAQWLAWRVKVPSILPLVLIGLIVGPVSTLFMPDGAKLLEPVYDPVNQKGLFPGQYLFNFVSLAIGIILFEGGLTLKRREIKTVGPAIVKLILVGTVVTLIGGALAAHYLMDLNWLVSVQFSALIIVTGPTVIAPILRNVPLNRNISTVLKWESIIIDPIGAFAAVLVFEFLLLGGTIGEFTSHVFIGFIKTLLLGLAIGSIAAFMLYFFIKKALIPAYLLNVLTLAMVLGAFVASDVLSKESGLLTVVVMGIVLGNLNVPNFREVLLFKESLSVLLISILFILLAAHIDLDDLKLVWDWRCFAVFGIVVLVLRPIAVFLSIRNSDLSFNEKAFISWIGPRGIVAAGVASLFGWRLTEEGFPDAEYITPLVFFIVLGTVLLNASTARLMAKLLKVIQPVSNGILIIGANAAARVIALYLKENDRHVVLLDSNIASVQYAQSLGLEALHVNIYTDDLEQHLELLDIGYLIAMTANHEVNTFATIKYKNVFGELGTFRLLSPEEMKRSLSDLPKTGIFSYSDDYLNLNETARDYPFMNEMPLESTQQLASILEQFRQTNQVPLFLKFSNNYLDIIPNNLNELKIDQSYKLVYLGKPLEGNQEQ